jgi:bacteriocin-like protein
MALAKETPTTKPAASADNLGTPAKPGDIELTEDELKKVSGGAKKNNGGKKEQ